MEQKTELTPKEKLERKKLRVNVKELKIRFTEIEAHLVEVAAASKAMADVEGSVGILIERADRTPEELKAVSSRLEHLDKRLELAFEEVPEMDERLSDIERSLSSLAERADRVPEEPVAILSRLQQIELRLPSLSFGELEERLNDMERSLSSLVQRASQAPKDLGAVLSRLEHLDERLEMTPEVISEELDERFSSVSIGFGGFLAENQLSERLVTLLSQLEQIEVRLAGVSGLAFDELAERMGDIERSLSSLAERADETPGGLSAIISRLEHLETRVEETPGSVSRELDGRLRSVEDNVGEVVEASRAMGDIERSLSSLAERADETPGGLSAIISRLEHLETRVEETPGSVSRELDGRLRSVEDNVGEVVEASRAMGDIERSLSSLAERADETPDGLSAIISRLEHLETRVEETPGSVSRELDGRLRSVEDNVGEVVEASRAMGDIERSLSSLAERADETPDGLSAIISRLEHLETYLSMTSEVITEEFEARFGTGETQLKEELKQPLVPISGQKLLKITTPAPQHAAENPYETFSEPGDGDLGCFTPDGPQPSSGPTLKEVAYTDTSDFGDQSAAQPSCGLDEPGLEETTVVENATYNEPLSAETAATSGLDPLLVTDATSSPTESVEEELHGRWYKKMTVAKKKTTNTSDERPTRNAKNNHDADKEMIELVLAGPAKQFRRENLREPANWIGTCRFDTDPEEYVRECCVLDISTVGARLQFSDTTLEEIVERQILFSDHLRGEIRHVEEDYGTVIVGVEFLNFNQDDELTREAQSYIQSLKRVAAGSTW